MESLPGNTHRIVSNLFCNRLSWTMSNSHHIRIRRQPGTVTVFLDNTILAETQTALVLYEGNMSPVFYFPRKDVKMAYFTRSNLKTLCPFKGSATYFSLATAERKEDNAAWSYEDPKDNVTEIQGYIAFYNDKCRIVASETLVA